LLSRTQKNTDTNTHFFMLFEHLRKQFVPSLEMSCEMSCSFISLSLIFLKPKDSIPHSRNQGVIIAEKMTLTLFSYPIILHLVASFHSSLITSLKFPGQAVKGVVHPKKKNISVTMSYYFFVAISGSQISE